MLKDILDLFLLVSCLLYVIKVLLLASAAGTKIFAARLNSL
jgi:hypothetical protein